MFGLYGNSKTYFFISTLLILVLNQSPANGIPDFGKTHIVEAKGQHKATVVWLHGITENGFTWSLVLKMTGCQGIKFIVPTAPFRRISGLGGISMNAWFDIGAITPSGFTDTAGLDKTIKHATDLLSKETVPVAIGGFSQGSASTLYATAVYAKGSYMDGSPFTTNFTSAVALSGWLPGFAYLWRGKFNGPGAKSRMSLPILQTHGSSDLIVAYAVGLASSRVQKNMGFANLQFKTHPLRGHLYYPGELKEMCEFYQQKFGIKG